MLNNQVVGVLPLHSDTVLAVESCLCDLGEEKEKERETHVRIHEELLNFLILFLFLIKLDQIIYASVNKKKL